MFIQSEFKFLIFQYEFHRRNINDTRASLHHSCLLQRVLPAINTHNTSRTIALACGSPATNKHDALKFKDVFCGEAFRESYDQHDIHSTINVTIIQPAAQPAAHNATAAHTTH